MIQVRVHFDHEELLDWHYHAEDNTLSFTCNGRHYRLPNEAYVVITKCVIRPTQSSTGG